ncbi:lipoprotein [Kitasatospora cinereorecta]
MSAWRRAGVSLTVAAVIAGVAGCQGAEQKPAAGAPKAESRSGAAVTQMLTAAYKKTAAAKSAKVRLTIEMPAATEGGTMEMSGTMGWGPTVMDMTMKGEAFQVSPDAPEQIRMVMVDDVMYMDMGAEASAEMDGKRWMKMDFAAIAEASGDAGVQKQMTRGMEDMNQDPAQQLALLLESPNLKHVGAEKVGGVETQHYKGSLSVDEMLTANESLDVLTDKERESLLASVKKSGIKGYDTEVWVNEDGYPMRMNVGMDSPQGEITMVADYSDYGTDIAVTAPPANATFDLMEMLEGIGQGADSTTT